MNKYKSFTGKLSFEDLGKFSEDSSSSSSASSSTSEEEIKLPPEKPIPQPEEPTMPPPPPLKMRRLNCPPVGGHKGHHAQIFQEILALDQDEFKKCLWGEGYNSEFQASAKAIHSEVSRKKDGSYKDFASLSCTHPRYKATVRKKHNELKKMEKHEQTMQKSKKSEKEVEKPLDPILPPTTSQ